MQYRNVFFIIFLKILLCHFEKKRSVLYFCRNVPSRHFQNSRIPVSTVLRIYEYMKMDGGVMFNFTICFLSPFLFVYGIILSFVTI